VTDQAARPTIVEVSRRAGVSISSVSRALNGRTTNADIIQRVNDAVAELGYVPSAIAQSFRKQLSGQVAFAVEDIGNPAYLAMVRSIQPVLRAAGIRLMLHSTEGIVSDEIDVVERLQTRLVDGLIICPIRPDERLLGALTNAAKPVVVIGRLPRRIPVDNVRGESRDGARLAVEHLIARGSRRIGLINGPSDTLPSQARRAGYLDALEQHGLADPALVEEADAFSFEAGQAAAGRLLDRVDVDGLLGITDRLAFGGMHAARERGRSVPGDVRIVGIDDSELAATSIPGLTSVDLGAVERGRIAAELMIARLGDESRPPRTISIPPRLTERETTR
jgi:LacI family transcriptional regulator